MRLSTPMHDALIAAARNPLRRTHDDTAGAPPWPAHPASLAALTRHELLERTELRNRKGFKVTVWAITDLGHETLNPPPRFRPDRPRFICRPTRNSGDYTANPARAIDPLEVMDDAVLVTFAQRAREAEEERRRRNGQALDAQAVELRLEQARLVARERGMDVSGELWVIRQIVATGREQSAARRLAKLETQLQQRAA
jgi:hypothetical protein